MNQITQALQEEFSDLIDAGQITRVLLRLLLAAALGGILGYERASQGKAAGVRTHMLVAMACALFVLVPQLGGMQLGDLSRVMQGVVAGIGFLCAGSIIKNQNDDNIQGLTTAAGIFMTAAIGVACGLGREATAVLSAVLALVALALIPKTAGEDSGKDPGKDGQ